MKLSLALIVKNEQGVLINCLASVAHLVDEIIIVDTGSTDNTIAEANQFQTASGEPVRIEHFQWINDFSAARNYSFSKASGDYIFWLDADDTLKPAEQAKFPALRATLGSHDAYLMKYDYQQDGTGKSTCGLFRHRIVRNNQSIYWNRNYPIHECLVFPPGYTEHHTDIVVTHTRTEAMIAGDMGRNHSILQALVDSGKADQRMRFYHATELTRVGKHQESINYFTEYFKLCQNGQGDWHENMVNGRLYQSYAYLALSQHDLAIEACIQGIKLDPRWAEFYCTIGQVYYDRQDWEQAHRWFTRATQCVRPQTWGTVVEDHYTWVPYDRLCMCAFHLGKLQEAYEHNEKALSWHQEDRLLFNRDVIADLLFPGRVLERPIRLNLGSGGRPISSYRRTDVVPCPGVVEVFDQAQIPYHNSSVSALYSEHSLEHCQSHYQADAIMAEWVRVLKPRGRLTLKVPDLEICCQQFVNEPQRRDWFKYTIYGIQKSNDGEPAECQYHRTGFTADNLIQLAAKHGMYITKLERYDGWGTPSLHMEAFQATKSLRMFWVVPGLDEDYPSSRIRVLNVHRQLLTMGVDSRVLVQPTTELLKQADVVVFADVIDPSTMAYLARYGIPTVVDVCEDIFTTVEHLRAAACLTCCSTVLAQKLAGLARAVCIPDAYESGSQIDKPDRAKVQVIACCMDGSTTRFERLVPIIAELGMELITITEGAAATIKWDRNTWLQELSKADIVIVPQYEWLQPAKSNTRVTQAMALGLPVICSPLQAYREAIVHGETGFICENGADWEVYLKLLRDDPALRARVGAAAQLAVGNYSIEAIGQQWVELAETLARSAHDQPRVDIVIPTWKNLEYLKLCIESIRACTDWPYQLIVVNQDDQSSAWLNGQRDIIHIQTEHIHFSAATNVGVRAGTSPYVMLLNDDTIVSEGWLAALMTEVVKPGVGMVGPLSNCDKWWLHTKDIVVGGVDLVPGMRLPQVQHIIPQLQTFRHPKEVWEREWIAFWAVLLPRTAWDAVGELDEQFKSGCEDLDYGKRLRAAGYGIRQTYDSFIFHFGGMGRQRWQETNPTAHQAEDVENHRLLARKYGTTEYIPQDVLAKLNVVSKPKRAIIYTGAAWEPWAACSVDESGIGGSETMAAHAARELARRGYETKLIGDPRQLAGTYDGVQYIQYDQLYKHTDGVDLLVTSRRADLDWSRIRAQTKLCWVHDIWVHANRATSIHPEAIDKYLTLSSWHRDFFIKHHGNDNPALEVLLASKTVLTHNVINQERFVKQLPRDPYRFIYSSSPDRGLDVLLSVWPRIMAECPRANLHVFYGFDNWEKSVVAMGNQQQIDWMNRVKQLLEQPGVYYHGRVGQVKLAQEFLKSSIWAYPTYFTETFCAPPGQGSLVHTKNGMKPIEAVTVGEFVLTHKGRFRPVTKVLCRQHIGPVYDIKRKKDCHYTTLTAEHPLWACDYHRNTADGNKSRSGRIYNKKNPRMMWLSAGTLTPKVDNLVTVKVPTTGAVTSIKLSDYINRPVIDGYIAGSAVAHAKRHYDIIPLTTEFMFLLGLFAADGCACLRKRAVIFSLGLHERHLARRVKAYFGGSIKRSKRHLMLKVRFYDAIWSRVLYKLVGKKRDKHLPAFIYDVSLELQGAFIDGAMAGDGWFDRARGLYRYTSVSPSLAYGVSQLLTNQDILPSMVYSKKRQAYDLTWQANPKSPCHIVQDDYISTKVAKVKQYDYDGPVYNLEVEEDNSYVINRTVVHNCITAVEAMAAGLPVVSSALAGLIDTVGDAGILLGGNPWEQTYQDEFVQRCVTLLQDQAFREAYVGRGRTKAATYTIERMIDGWLEL